jgi:hypothetical protein
MIRHCRLVPVIVVMLAAVACGGVNTYGPTDPSSSQPICQAGQQCCTSQELVCTGNPDGTMVCTCYKDWTCDTALSPKKCSQSPVDSPDGASGWKCVVESGKDVCTRATGVPTGKNGWVCKQTGGTVTCERPVNTPDGGGGWGCAYVADSKVCTRNAPQTDSGVGPKPDSGTIVPPPAWDCRKDANGVQICTKSGGLPPGGNNWKCAWKKGIITCEGASDTPPGGGGWTCTEQEFIGWRCTAPAGSGDTPPGGGSWTCTSSSEQGGIVCTQLPPVKPGQECVPNTKMWCDGAIYCGYGQVVCGPDGKWKLNSDGYLDCVEVGDQRPNTVCACYFFYFNQDCCETPDCIVPAGTIGQVCPVSKGQYCDYCTPQNPECTSGGKCIVTAKHETFCGQSCASAADCPKGSLCMSVQVSNGGNVKQCIPADQSCYY